MSISDEEFWMLQRENDRYTRERLKLEYDHNMEYEIPNTLKNNVEFVIPEKSPKRPPPPLWPTAFNQFEEEVSDDEGEQKRSSKKAKIFDKSTDESVMKDKNKSPIIVAKTKVIPIAVKDKVPLESALTSINETLEDKRNPSKSNSFLILISTDMTMVKVKNILTKYCNDPNFIKVERFKGDIDVYKPDKKGVMEYIKGPKAKHMYAYFTTSKLMKPSKICSILIEAGVMLSLEPDSKRVKAYSYK